MAANLPTGLDPRTPVIVGVAQLSQRVDDLAEAVEPVGLMVETARLAAADAGAPGLLGVADSIRTVQGQWDYPDPARLVGEWLGIPDVRTTKTGFGGNFVQQLVADSANDILAGARDVVLITTAEWGRTRRRANKAGLRAPVTPQEVPPCPDTLAPDKPLLSDHEAVIGMFRATSQYGLLDNALRTARGESAADQIRRRAELWSAFSSVAASNPHAWIQREHTVDEIATPSRTNRMVSHPYPKLLCANNGVDMAGSIILCSLETARRHGVSLDKMVFPHAGTDAVDTPYVSTRRDLHTSPPIRIGGRRVLELAGVGIDDLTHVDVYSCFPVAVEVAIDELGLDRTRPLTVTGGLTFNGGPLNSYVMHSICRTVELLREAPDAWALVTANGGNLTKHAFGVYRAAPPTAGFRSECVQAEVDPLLAPRVCIEDHHGPATVESWTMTYDRESLPQEGCMSLLTDDGARTWATTKDPTLLAAMAGEGLAGRRAVVDGLDVLVDDA